MNHKALFARGFSYVELVVAVAVIGLVAAVGIGLFVNYKGAVATSKLDKDVVTLNSAVAAYLANGGSLTSVTEVDAVLAKLKTKAADSQAEQISGMRGSFVDSRVKAVFQTEAEAATAEPRVVWNATTKKFEVSTGGGAGVKEFVLDEALSGPAEEETRNVNLKLATEDKWVWDYEDTTAPGRGSFTEVPVASVSPTSPTATGAGANGPLLPPVFSNTGGTYPLIDYELTVTLSDPNPGGVSQLVYSLDGGMWQIYSSVAIPVAPGMTIGAYAMSIDPDNWMDSPVLTHTYLTTPVELDLNFTVPQLAVTYEEVGGAMIPGSMAGPGPQPPGSVTLANAAQIPAQYLNDSVFTVHWTYDGSDPLTSSARQTTPSFTGGFPGQTIDYSLVWWGGGTVLPIQVVAQSLDSTLVTDSTVATQVLTADPVPLREPVINITGPDITIDLVTDYGDMPVGARIYYTIDGNDPGDIGGVPTSGTLYTGPFPSATIPGGNPVKARVFAPDTFEPWFVASGVAEETPPAAAIIFSMSVSTSAP